MKGLIALDIDGTITVDMKPTPPPVVEYLHHLVNNEWTIAFITGRTFHMGQDALTNLDFPYYYAFQNGAAILHMPEQVAVQKKYLSRELLPLLADMCRDLSGGLIVYSGYEQNDRCYYVPGAFEPELLVHLLERTKIFREDWNAVSSYDVIPLKEFSVIKFFGEEVSAQEIAKRIYQAFGLDVSVIRDPYNQKNFLMQATYPGINKGQALLEIKKLAGITGITIAVGDDNNDLPMFEKADLSLAMADAPALLKNNANFIAPPASQMGIIEGLRLILAGL